MQKRKAKKKIKRGAKPAASFPEILLYTLAFGSGVNSFMGKIPVGNTGGANVPPFQPMEIPANFETLLKKYKKLR